MRLFLATCVLSVLPLLGAGQRVTFVYQNTSGSGVCSALPFTDSFSRPNGPLGTKWTDTSGGTIQIISNTATVPSSTTTGNQMAFTNCPGFTTSQYSQGVLNPAASTYVGFALFATNVNNYYFIECSSASCLLQKNVAGTVTFIGAFTNTPTTGQTVCAEIDSGATIKLKIAGTYDPTTFSIGGLSSGSAGVYFNGNGAGTSGSMTTYQTNNGVCP